jgi:L-alanine-DL-glutamate epimerase-like enolase superfamily enzyme
MVDINQRWSVHEAIAIGCRVEEFNLAWLEDVTAHDDYQGLAQVAAALSTPVCGGEILYGIAPFRQMLAHRSVDIVMIDLLRVGGIGPWMKVAAMAEAFNIPVVSHLLPEIHVHLVAAAPNATVVEYMPWTWRLFDNPPMPKDGTMTVPTAPGLGFGFAPDLFEKYGVQ